MKPATVRRHEQQSAGAVCAEVRIDGQSLLMANEHVRAVEPASALKSHGPNVGSIGELEVDSECWPVFCFDKNLRALEDVPPSRRSCVLLESLNGRFAILCDELLVVDDEALELVPVPRCLRGEQDLVDALAICSGRVLCLLSVDRLAATLDLDLARGDS